VHYLVYELLLQVFAASLPAFLQNSATFYGAYRGVWSTIVIVISLGPTTGASLNGLLYQCLGTIFGGLVSMAVWYMVDQKVAGVIVLSFIVTLFRVNYIEG
jgi:Fusaric acid resistance protein-like